MRAVHRIVIEVFCVEGAQNDYDQDRTIQYHPRDIFDSPLAARYPCPDLIGVEELTRQLEDARVGDDKTPGDDDRTNASDPLFVHASSAGIVHESLAWLRTASGEGIEQEEHCDHFDCAPESVRQSASDVPELAPPPPRLPPIIDVPADYRFGPLSIEWMDQNWDVNMGEQSQDDPDTTTGKLPQPSSIPFVTGHTELNYGILHLYREDVTSTVAPRCENAAGAIIHNSLPTSTATGHAGTSSSAAAASTSSSTSAIGTPDIRLGNDAFTEAYPDVNVICALAVPIHTTLADYLQFIAPMRKRISHFRIVRDSLPNRYMVLMKFRSPRYARAFHQEFHGKPFNSMEPEVCSLVAVKSIEFKTSALAPYVFPYPEQQKQQSMTATPYATPPQLNARRNSTVITHELPTCPVCLERMDTAISGIVTTICQHTFHCHCLQKWGDSSCPVCRYTQKMRADVPDHQNVCRVCSTTANLWICLICGNIGCGRYKAVGRGHGSNLVHILHTINTYTLTQAHAHSHFLDTNHLYALELESQRVWDYAGDGYVHRLIQNNADGKLVELDPMAVPFQPTATSGNMMAQEKMDALGLEFSYLLSSSLESQRLYYEEKSAEAAQIISDMHRHLDSVQQASTNASDSHAVMTEAMRQQDARIEELHEQMQIALNDQQSAGKREQVLLERIRILEKSIGEERAMADSLRSNQAEWQQRLHDKEEELRERDATIRDLEEQVSDLMIFLDAKSKVEKMVAGESSEAAQQAIIEGSVGVSAAQPSTPTRGSSKAKKRTRK